MFGLGMWELAIVGVIAVLLFGSKLPDVARSLGGSYREFRKGLSDLQTHVHDVQNTYTSSGSSGPSYDAYDDYEEATAPKFEPPPAEPQVEATASESPAESEDDTRESSSSS